MNKYIASALVALAAACKPIKKLAGTYVRDGSDQSLIFKDTVQVKTGRDNGRAALFTEHRAYIKSMDPADSLDKYIVKKDTMLFDRKQQTAYPKHYSYKLNKRQRTVSFGTQKDTYHKVRR
jgi:hypothetical protein